MYQILDADCRVYYLDAHHHTTKKLIANYLPSYLLIKNLLTKEGVLISAFQEQIDKGALFILKTNNPNHKTF